MSPIHWGNWGGILLNSVLTEACFAQVYLYQVSGTSDSDRTWIVQICLEGDFFVVTSCGQHGFTSISCELEHKHISSGSKQQTKKHYICTSKRRDLLLKNSMDGWTRATNPKRKSWVWLSSAQLVCKQYLTRLKIHSYGSKGYFGGPWFIYFIDLDALHTIQTYETKSQIVRKENPRKSPSVPPKFETRVPKF